MKNKLKASQCPPELAKMLEIVNLVPADVVFPVSEGLQRIYSGRRRKFGDKYFNPSWGAAYEDAQTIYDEYLFKRDELIEDVIKDYPALVKYVFDPNIPGGDFVYAFRYLRFAEVRVWLRRIAIQNTSYAISQGVIDHIYINIPGDPYFKPETSAEYFINDKGEMDFRFNPVIEAVKGFEAIRLRMCPMCKKIFWAKKINSITCGEKKCIDDYQNLKKKNVKEAKKKEKKNVSLPKKK